MDGNALGQPQESVQDKKNGKGCRFLFGCFSFFIILLAIVIAFFFIGVKSGFFNDMFEGFKEEMIINNIQNNQYMTPNAVVAGTEGGDEIASSSMFETPTAPVSLVEKRSRMEVWHYVYMQREDGYKEDFPKEIAEHKFNSNSEAVTFFEEEIRNKKYNKNEIEAIKNRLDLYTAKVALENIDLEIKTVEEEKKNANPN